MKKIIILASILLLAGAGCAKTQVAPTDQKNNQANADKKQIMEETDKMAESEHVIESNITDEELAEFKKLFEQKSAELSFKSYYPTFIPEEINLNKTSLLVSDIPNLGKVLTYLLGDVSNPESAWVSFQEQLLDTKKPKHIIASSETELVNLDGYALADQNAEGETTYYLVFTTEDEIFIKLTSQKFNIDTLTKIAEAMK